MPLGYQRSIPGAAVLLVERDQLTRRRDPRRPAGLGQQHQRHQAGHLTVRRQQCLQQPGQPNRLEGEVAAYGLLPGIRSEVTLVEDQEEDRQDAGDAGREVLGGGDPVRDPRRLDLALRAGDPLTHSGLLHQEGAGDLGYGQPADHAQRQRDPGLHRQGRVAAGEDQPEPVVVDRAERLRRGVVVQHLSLLLLVVTTGLAAQPVDGAPVSGSCDPGAGIWGYAVAGPALDSDRERLRRHLLGDVQVAEAPLSTATTRAHSSRWTRVIASVTSVTRSRRDAPRPCPGRPSIPRRPASAPRRGREPR